MRFIIPILLLAFAVGPASAAAAASDDAQAPAEPIRLSLSLYIVDAAEGSESGLSSERDAESLAQVVERMQTIWDQAGIEFDVRSITRINAPADSLADLGRGDAAAFLNSLYDGDIEVPDPGAINGFYVRSLGRINGVAPSGTRVFLVTDEPSVHHERVSSHEIGHILSLHHEAVDSSHLMFSGTNGMELADDEIAVARYAAQGIIDGLR